MLDESFCQDSLEGEPACVAQAHEASKGHNSFTAVQRRARPAPRSLLVHAVAFAWFAFVWLWHLTPAAAGLPGNHGFGWFFRFLTFYSFTLQTLQLGLATADDVVRARSGQRTSVWTRYTDDLACAIFALTHVVSIMFYTVQGTTKMMVEGGSVARPPWLDVSVHAFNTLVAWADLLYSEPRSFSAASERLSCVLVTVYLAYLMLCRSMNGRFPYPILNALPYPFGFLAFVAAGLLLFATSFRVGKLMNARLRHVNISIRITRTTPLARRRWGGSGRRSGGGSSSSGVQTDADGSSSGSEGGSGVLGSERGGSVTAHSLSIGVLLGKQRRRQRAAAKA